MRMAEREVSEFITHPQPKSISVHGIGIGIHIHTYISPYPDPICIPWCIPYAPPGFFPPTRFPFVNPFFPVFHPISPHIVQCGPLAELKIMNFHYGQPFEWLHWRMLLGCGFPQSHLHFYLIIECIEFPGWIRETEVEEALSPQISFEFNSKLWTM